MLHSVLYAQLEARDETARDESRRVGKLARELPPEGRVQCALQHLERLMFLHFQWPTEKGKWCEFELGKACLAGLVARLDDVARQVTSTRWPKCFTDFLDATMCVRLVRCKHYSANCDVCHQAGNGAMALDMAGPTVSNINVLDENVASTFDAFLTQYDDSWASKAFRRGELHPFDKVFIFKRNHSRFSTLRRDPMLPRSSHVRVHFLAHRVVYAWATLA
jgi:hypothetical protein